MKKFSYQQFSIKNLIKAKNEQSLTVGIALPVSNEVGTINNTINVIRTLGGLIDDLVIIDSDSIDGSFELCKKLGVRITPDTDFAKNNQIELRRGKGFNLWAGLCQLDTDIVIWVDTDIKNMGQRFIVGILGPMLLDNEIKFVKGYYQRPKRDARVTEILVRPYLNLIFPEVSDFIQPLSGEYGGRREFLTTLKYYSGYSVDIALLIQARMSLNNNQIAQSFLGQRIHELQSVASLGKMGASILRTLLEVSKEYGRLEWQLSELPDSLQQFSFHDRHAFRPQIFAIKDYLLPPINIVKNN